MRFLVLLFAGLTITGAAYAQNNEINPEDFLPDGERQLEEQLPDASDEALVPTPDDVPLEQAVSRLDELFGDLKRAANSSYAETIAQSIWAEWFKSGSATIDLWMNWAREATRERDFHIALDYLDQIVTQEPDFAEGWNRRATVHFMMNNYAKSMSDITRVLELEPRHFGALSGMAIILERTGRKEAALKAWSETLSVYPAMENAQNAVIRLEEELGGDPA
ncbi:MAG: hypothetical protein AAGI92_10765 [Pseudomonadota bacterium]